MARSDVYAVYVWEARVRNGQTQPFAEAVASPLPAADVRCPTWLHLSRHLEARSSVVSLMLTLQLQAARLILAGVFLTSERRSWSVPNQLSRRCASTSSYLGSFHGLRAASYQSLSWRRALPACLVLTLS